MWSVPYALQSPQRIHVVTQMDRANMEYVTIAHLEIYVKTDSISAVLLDIFVRMEQVYLSVRKDTTVRGRTSPMPCTIGTFNPYSGNGTEKACLKCTPGLFCKDKGLSVPSGPCSPGFYCNGGSVTPHPLKDTGEIYAQWDTIVRKGRDCSLNVRRLRTIHPEANRTIGPV